MPSRDWRSAEDPAAPALHRGFCIFNDGLALPIDDIVEKHRIEEIEPWMLALHRNGRTDET
jgi:hypothetical protein